MMSQLAVNPRAKLHTQCISLLQTAERLGWLVYLGVELSGKRSEPDLFRVRLLSGRVRVLQGPEVRPWVLGMADVHGVPEKVAYRPGLVDDEDGS